MEKSDQIEMDEKGAKYGCGIIFGTPLIFALLGIVYFGRGCWEQKTKGKGITIEQIYNGRTNYVQMVAIPQKRGINIFTGDALFGRFSMTDEDSDGLLDKVIFDKPAIAVRMAYSPGQYNEITNKVDLEKYYQKHYSQFYKKGRKAIPEGGFKIRPYY